MVKLLNCTRGHFWEADEMVAEPRCPECGAPPDVLPMFEPTASAAEPITLAVVEPDLVDAGGKPVVAGYEIREDLGKGPTGLRRYLAKQTLINREVLLEVVLAREDSSQRVWSSLRSEAGALGRLQHPNIVALYEVGERDRQLFYNVLEWTSGPTLAQKCADKLLPIAQVLRLMELLARAVQQASEQNLLHRHLEPASVLLQPVSGPILQKTVGEPLGAHCKLHSSYYIPRISGHGLARRPVEGDPIDAELYQDAGYLSPEQAWARSRQYGPHTDVYGLGGILYFLLTGQAPFRGPTLGDILDAIQTAPPKPPNLARRVPADLAAICKKCLARQTSRRYRDAGELADELQRVALGYPARASQPTALTHLGRWMRRRPALVMLLLVSLLSVVGMFVVSATAYDAAEQMRIGELRRVYQDLNSAREAAKRFRDELEPIRHERLLMSYRKRIDRVLEALAKENVNEARSLLDEFLPPERHIEWHYLAQKVRRKAPIRLTDRGEVVALAVSRNHAWRVVTAHQHEVGATARGLINLWDLENPEKARTSIELERTQLKNMCLAPNENWLAVSGLTMQNTQVKVYALENLERPTLHSTIHVNNRVARGLAFSPDSTLLAFENDPGEIHFLPVTRGRREPRRDVQGSRVDFASSSGMRLIYRSDGSGLFICSPGRSEVRYSRVWQDNQLSGIPSPGPVIDIAYCEVTNFLAIAHGKDEVSLGTFQGDFPAITLEKMGSEIRQLAFSPDGERLAIACADDSIHIWARAASWVEMLRIKESGVVGLALVNNGRTLIAAGPKETVVLGETP